MKHLEVIIELKKKEETELQRQLLIYELGEIGYSTFEERSAGELAAYILQSEYSEERLEEVLEQFEVVEAYSTFALEERDWNKEWEMNYYQPLIAIEGELAVRASFHPKQEGVRQELVIDPKMAFGTGNHATTLGMLQLLHHVQPRGMQVIDMGCGSGILGIYAMKLGARACTSIDFDEWSVVNTEENAEINDVSITVLHGDAGQLANAPVADLFLANITRNIILQDLDKYLARLSPDGLLQLSGFLENDLTAVKEALEERGCQILTTVNPEKEWVALLAKRCR